jgi:hypothetical protein
VTDNDHSLGINYDWLAEAECFDRGGHGIHGSVIVAGIARIGLDLGNFS